MELRINFTSGVPIYLQLMEQIKHAVETGAIHGGEQLPTIRKVAEELAMNPNTVARAYRELEDEGIIEVRHGSGAYVAEPKTSSAKAAAIRRAGKFCATRSRRAERWICRNRTFAAYLKRTLAVAGRRSRGTEAHLNDRSYPLTASRRLTAASRPCETSISQCQAARFAAFWAAMAREDHNIEASVGNASARCGRDPVVRRAGELGTVSHFGAAPYGLRQ